MSNFFHEVDQRIQSFPSNEPLMESAKSFLNQTIRAKYSYNFQWLGRPIIQYPQDIVAMQELIWDVKPDLIIETGIAHGGSLILSASMLAQLDLCDAIKSGDLMLNPSLSKRKVLGIDVDIRKENLDAINNHPMSTRIQMIEGSSIDENVIKQVYKLAENYHQILVCLDSNHTHDHVLAELEAYAPLVSKGSYCVVFDTVVEDLPLELSFERPWSPGNNPKTAVWKFLGNNKDFVIDKKVENKLLVTVAPDGYLKRIK